MQYSRIAAGPITAYALPSSCVRCAPPADSGRPKHLRGEIILLWDRSPIHIKRKEVSEFLRQHPRIHVEEFPAYAPELNPAEYIWNQTDRALSNTAPQDVEELQALLSNSVAKISNSQKLLWSCIYASDLPWR